MPNPLAHFGRLKYRYMNPHWRFMLVGLPIQIIWLTARTIIYKSFSNESLALYDQYREVEMVLFVIYSAALYLTFGWLGMKCVKRLNHAASYSHTICPSCGYDCSSIPDFTQCPECGLTGNADRFREIWTNPKAR